MDAASFTRIVHNGAERLLPLMLSHLKLQSPQLLSKAMNEELREQASFLCAPLRTLSAKEVESTVFEKFGLHDQRLVTCLVPYQLAVNIILSKLPAEVRRKCIEELKIEEEAIKLASRPQGTNRWIQWVETDVYVSTGTAYYRRMFGSRARRRIPVIAMTGHTQHGKTALLDALQSSDIAKSEPHGITQVIRSCTVFRREATIGTTFIDTPGHQLFVESRFHAQYIADAIVLVISLVEGVQSQTHEAIIVALNLDKPIVVVITKGDLLTDSFHCEMALQRLLSELNSIGLEVFLANSVQGDIELPEYNALGVAEKSAFFLPMKQLNPSFRGSGRKPVLNLRRRCVGVSVSPTTGQGLNVVWRVLDDCGAAAPVMCYSVSPKCNEQNCSVQAVIVESSKHLFDEEGFRHNVLRQRVQKRLDRSATQKEVRHRGKGFRANLNSLFNTQWRLATQKNRTSSSTLVITAIVKEGTLRKGTNFVADQAEGKVDFMMDYWGNPIEAATPGMAVTIVDSHSMSGCPGTGTHLLSTVDSDTRFRVQSYRQLLQWYVECFTSKLHYLRPRGMDVSFAHLGDYGQLQRTDSLEHQLLFPPEENHDNGDLLSCSSVGSFIQARNREESIKANLLLTSSNPTTSDTASTTRQPLPPDVSVEVVESTWTSFRQVESALTLEQQRQLMSECIQIGVLLKVDSWHSARMLSRELSRLGTTKIVFQVLAVRFGELQMEDVLFFGQAVKIVVCFRTPKAGSQQLHQFLETFDLWTLETDSIFDVVTYMKWCAVAMHKEVLACAEERRRPPNYMDVPPRANTNPEEGKSPRRNENAKLFPSPRLLIYRNSIPT